MIKTYISKNYISSLESLMVFNCAKGFGDQNAGGLLVVHMHLAGAVCPSRDP